MMQRCATGRCVGLAVRAVQRSVRTAPPLPGAGRRRSRWIAPPARTGGARYTATAGTSVHPGSAGCHPLHGMPMPLASDRRR